jgi:hypothetical protein
LLRVFGVSAVETAVGAETDGSALARHLRLCEQAGLVASLHPYSEGTRANPAYFAPDAGNDCTVLHTGFLAVATEAALRQHAPAIVNVHAAAAPAGHPRRDLLEQSVRFFQWAREWCENNAPNVRPVSELQIAPDAGEPIQRIADNYAELFEIAVRSDVGICWDFSHQRFLVRLIDAGFEGTVLEVLPGAFLAMGELAALECSVSALVSFCRQYRCDS